MIVEFKCGLCLDVEEIAIVGIANNDFYRVALKSGTELMVSSRPEKDPYHDRARLIEKWKFSQASQR